MSVIGTGIAAGVAQTAQQAQQVSRQRDKKQAEDNQASERTREVFERQLRALEEDDGSESAQLQVQPDLHDRDHPLESVTAQPKQKYQQPDDQEQPADTATVDAAEVLAQLGTQAPPELSAEATAEAYRKRLVENAQNTDQPLYKHLDLEA